MDACPADARLALILTGELPPEEVTAVDAHLRVCEDCRRRLDDRTSLDGLLDEAVTAATRGAGEAGPPLPAVPGFDVRRELDRGGHGVVYLAWNRAAGREVALKVLRAGRAATAAERARFRADAAALARLAHPHIVPLYSVGEFAGHPYFEMEFLPGGSLADPGHAPAGDLLAVVGHLSALARAVHFAYSHGVVHRDLKPGNVLLAADGTPKVADFGLAQFDRPGEVVTPTAAALGTPGYLAPELASGARRPADPRTDVYGLGAVAYHWLTGRPPFEGATPHDTVAMAVAGHLLPLRRRRRGVHPDLETVVLKCLDPDPRGRYATAADLAADLDRHRAGYPVAARPVGPVRHLTRRVRRHPRVSLLVAAFAATLLGGVAGLAVLYRQAEANADLAARRLATARAALRTVTRGREQQFWFPAGVEHQDEGPLHALYDLQADALADFAGDPAAWHDTAYAMLQLADMLSRVADPRSVIGKAERARESLADLRARHPHPDHDHSYGEACVQLSGYLELAGDAGRAGALRREAFGITADLVARFPDRDKYQVTHAAFGRALADALATDGRFDEAEDHYAGAIRLGRRLVGRDPGHPARREYLIAALCRYATLVNRVYRDPRDYDRLMAEVVGEYRAGLRVTPARVAKPHQLGVALRVRASVLDRTGDPGRAADCRRACAEFVAELGQANPDAAFAWRAELGHHLHEAYRLAGRDDPAAGRALAAHTAAAETAVARRPDLPEFHWQRGLGMGLLPGLTGRRADPEGALRLLAARPPGPADPPDFRHLAGILQAECGRLDEALAALADVAPKRAVGQDVDATAELCRVRAWWLAGRREEARRELAALSAVLHADFATTDAERCLHDRAWRCVYDGPPPSWAIPPARPGRALLFRDEELQP